MVIKIDIDGVLRNILNTMCDIYNKEFCTNIKEDDVEVYYVDNFFTLIKERLGISGIKFFFEDNGFRIFRCSKPYDGVRDAMNKLHEMGHKIVIVSFQRSYENMVDTLEWLNSNNIYYDDICFTKNKDIVKADIMVDDNPEFLYQITDNCQAVLIDMPYNKNCGDFKRCKSFCDFVNNLEKNKILKDV